MKTLAAATILILATLTTTPATASTAGCNRHVTGTPGKIRYTAHIITDTCHNAIKAAAHYISHDGGTGAWVHGQVRTRAGTTSTATGFVPNGKFTAWGYDWYDHTCPRPNHPNGCWVYKQLGHI